MGRFALILGVALFGVVRQAHAFCQPGTVKACFLNGKQGTQTCGSNGIFGPCVVPSDPPPPSGKAQPKYKILTVVYAPPGKAGGGSSSSVTYGSGSSTGTTTTTKSAFKQSYSVSATASGGILHGVSVGLSFAYSRNSSDSTADDVKKTADTALGQGGPAIDGIDHNRDQIWLWLRPMLKVTLPTTSSVTWTFDPSQTMNIQFVFVGHLKDPSQMPPGVKDQLDAAGLTTSDYAQILLADPFANGDVPVDPNRFATLNTTFPYEPPFAPGDPSPTFSFTATHEVTSTSTSTTTKEYTTGLTISGDTNFLQVFKTSLKADNSWTWTDENSHSDAVGSSESASVTIGGPSFGYTGPTDVAVYYDLIYKTFAFQFLPPSLQAAQVQGLVVSDSNAPVAGKEVAVVADGITYRTFTNAVGEFHVPGVRGAVTQLRVDGVQEALPRSLDPAVLAVP